MGGLWVNVMYVVLQLCGFRTGQQLVVVQCPPQGSDAGAVIRNVPFL